MNSKIIRDCRLERDRFRELYYFALQYHSWKSNLSKISVLGSPNLDGMPHGSGAGDPTSSRAIKAAELSHKINIVEQCAYEAGGKELFVAVLKGVTTRNCTYNWLRNNGYAYCGKNQYYEARHRFYYLLDKKIY